jgi:predicted O-linked N-acetylglucosamine transferase (SPINDLY family)
MFGSLFKKKDTQKQPSAVPKEVNQSLSTTEAAALTKKVAALTTQIEQITDDKDKRHLLYNQLGATQVKLGNDLEAIAAYEASVKDKEEFGDAYNALLNLYETQRKQAAKAKNDDDIQKWITKTDALLDMSKRVMRSGFGY